MSTQTKKVSKNILRGYSLEYLTALHLIQQSENGIWGTTDIQKRLLGMRKEYYDFLLCDYPADASKMNKLAITVAGNLPEAKSEVNFVETSANGSEVYDIIYESIQDEIIKLSCKTSKMEDKSYRFNTADYIFDKEIEYLSSLFTQEDMDNKLSYADALARNNLTVRKMQSYIVQSLAEACRKKSGQTYDMMMKLISERFIGSGGYYKNLPNGSILFYPAHDSQSDIVNIVVDTISTTPTSVLMQVELYDEQMTLKQKYDMMLRVKFKDGVKKPVRLNSFGHPGNIGATIRLTLLNRKEE